MSIKKKEIYLGLIYNIVSLGKWLQRQNLFYEDKLNMNLRANI